MNVILIDGKRYLSNILLDRYRAIDTMYEIYCEYGGRMTCSGALVFSTESLADQKLVNTYIAKNPSLYAVEYDACCNTIVSLKKVEMKTDKKLGDIIYE